MVVSKMELYELLRKADGADVDFLREGVRTLAQALMEVEVTAQVGAERGERAPERRVTHRNGYRSREWDTRVGTVELAVPKLRAGSFFPSILEPRRRAERAIGTTKVAPVEVVTDRAPTYHRCSMSCSQRRSIAPTGTPTTSSRLTTVVSRRGFSRCEDSSRTLAPG